MDQLGLVAPGSPAHAQILRDARAEKVKLAAASHYNRLADLAAVDGWEYALRIAALDIAKYEVD